MSDSRSVHNPGSTSPILVIVLAECRLGRRAKYGAYMRTPSFPNLPSSVTREVLCAVVLSQPLLHALSPHSEPLYSTVSIRSLDGDNPNESRWTRLARRGIYENYKLTGRATTLETSNCGHDVTNVQKAPTNSGFGIHVGSLVLRDSFGVLTSLFSPQDGNT